MTFYCWLHALLHKSQSGADRATTFQHYKKPQTRLCTDYGLNIHGCGVVLMWEEDNSLLQQTSWSFSLWIGRLSLNFSPQKTVPDDYCRGLNLKTEKKKINLCTTREKRCAFTAARSTHTGLNIYGMAERTKGMPPGWPLTFGIDFPRLERGCWLRK